MADSQNVGSWLGGWLQAAKEKTVTTYEQVKRDVGEYTSTVQSDTRTVVSHTGQKIKKSLQSENTSLKQIFADIIGDGATLATSQSLTSHSELRINPNDRSKVRLRTVQVDPGTYLSPPSGDATLYDKWVESFDLDSHKGVISELLVSNAGMRSFYTGMVPHEISHTLFWRRYFYRMHQLQQDEERRVELMRRADQKSEDTYSWDEDDDEPFVNVAAEMKKDKQAKSDISLSSEDVSADQSRLPIIPESLDSCRESQKVTVTENDSTPLSFDSNLSSTPLSDAQSSSSPSCDAQDISSKFHSSVLATDVAQPSMTSPSPPPHADEPTDCQQLDLKVRLRGDLVVVGESSSESAASESNGVEVKDIGDDWADYAETEITEEQVKAAAECAKLLSTEQVVSWEDDEDDEWS